ncbi:bleomycin resistance protein [Aeromicrobium sp. Root236]|uniref:VOC family protein n=1 Tax=Aeromicrobium sp. Root236 TaxID=1736498 RepID=UPI0006FA1B75|nr:VOC family protein [Aeromicrobium sp. Root236]KRC64428.1 bleomycin resistance protein [Aeromicrobium sp. Root236]
MTAQLNHTIVESRDKREAATFFAEILGLPDPQSYGPFLVLETGNDVSLDFVDAQGPVHPQHYAFLVSDDEFDEVFGRIKERGLAYWADPFHRRPDDINHNDGGRGVYWTDPNGHNLEIITRPYGG